MFLKHNNFVNTLEKLTKILRLPVIIEKNTDKMKLSTFSLIFFLILASCSPQVIYQPVETIKEVHVKDSIYVTDTLVRIELEKARLSDFVDVGDTLVLQTDLSRSTAFIDTTAGKLKGTLENIKPYVEKPIPVQHKIEYRDTVITKEVSVPVEVEKVVKVVPWIYKTLSVIGLLALFLLALKLVFKA